MKVGIFGGTFDPIHNGHLITAVAVKELRNLDKIIFIPSFIAPHKIDRLSSSPEHRIEMLKRAIKGIHYFDYSDFEIKKEGVSYTIDTLKFLQNKYADIELIIGYDNLLEFSTWKDPDEILKMIKLVVLKRKVQNDPIVKDKFYYASEIIETPTIEISATAIRERVGNNLPINFLVPDAVMEYINYFNLYKD
jgi:nicotinate-nucleotide adenylyltransferase